MPYILEECVAGETYEIRKYYTASLNNTMSRGKKRSLFLRESRKLIREKQSESLGDS